MKKSILLLSCIMLGCFLSAQTKMDIIVQEFYHLYNDYLNAGMKKDYTLTEKIIMERNIKFEQLNKNEQDALINQLMDDLSSIKGDFIEKANRALFILPLDEPSRFDVLMVLGDMYIKQNNLEMFLSIINQLKHHPSASIPEYSDEIDELSKRGKELEPFPKSLNGFWLADRYMTADKLVARPWLVLDIMSDSGGKWAIISELSGLSSNTLNGEYSKLRKSDSFDFDVRDGSFLFSFNSTFSTQGNAETAQAMYDVARDTRASFYSLGQDTRGAKSVGEVFARSFTSSLVGGIMAGVYEGIGTNAATSRTTDDVIYITGTRINKDLIEAHIVYQQQQINSRSMAKENHILADQGFNLHRWKKEDGIVFGSPNCDPISPYVFELTKDMELYKIKKQTSFWRFKYGGIMFLGVAVGIAGIVYGVTTIPQVKWLILQKEQGLSKNDDMRLYYNEAEYNKNLTTGIIATALGTAITITVPIVEKKVRTNNRNKAVKEYNLRQLETITSDNRAEE